MTPLDAQKTRANRLLVAAHEAIDGHSHARPIFVLWYGFIDRAEDGEVVQSVVQALKAEGWEVSARQCGVMVSIDMAYPKGEILPPDYKPTDYRQAAMGPISRGE